MNGLTAKDRDSIAGTLDFLDWEVRQAKLRGNHALVFVYEDMAESLRKNVCEGHAASEAA